MSALAGGRISHLITTTADLDRTVAFYLGLGFTEVHVEADCAFLQLPDDPGTRLAFYRHDPDEPSEPLLVIDVPDLDVAISALSALNIAVSPARDVPHGRAATFTDPDGATVEIHRRSKP